MNLIAEGFSREGFLHKTPVSWETCRPNHDWWDGVLRCFETSQCSVNRRWFKAIDASFGGDEPAARQKLEDKANEISKDWRGKWSHMVTIAGLFSRLKPKNYWKRTPKCFKIILKEMIIVCLGIHRALAFGCVGESVEDQGKTLWTRYFGSRQLEVWRFGCLEVRHVSHPLGEFESSLQTGVDGWCRGHSQEHESWKQQLACGVSWKGVCWAVGFLLWWPASRSLCRTEEA